MDATLNIASHVNYICSIVGNVSKELRVPTIAADVTHILHHMEAEAATSDASQSPGVAGRAQQIRVLMGPFQSNNNTVGRGAWHALLRAQGNGSGLQSMLDDLDDNDDGQRIQQVIQRWVGKNKGPLDG